MAIAHGGSIQTAIVNIGCSQIQNALFRTDTSKAAFIRFVFDSSGNNWTALFCYYHNGTEAELICLVFQFQEIRIRLEPLAAEQAARISNIHNE